MEVDLRHQASKLDEEEKYSEVEITWKYSGIHKGRTTASSRSLLASVNPATSSHLTPGVLSNTSLSSIAAKSASGPSYCPFFDLPSSASPFYTLTYNLVRTQQLKKDGSHIFLKAAKQRNFWLCSKNTMACKVCEYQK